MSQTDTENSVVRAEVPGATDKDLRVIVLAHPLTRVQDFQTLGLPFEASDAGDGLAKSPLNPGTKVAVRPDHAQSLIGAGYAAGVSPDNAQQVRDALAVTAEHPERAGKPAEQADAASESTESTGSAEHVVEDSTEDPATVPEQGQSEADPEFEKAQDAEKKPAKKAAAKKAASKVSDTPGVAVPDADVAPAGSGGGSGAAETGVGTSTASTEPSASGKP